MKPGTKTETQTFYHVFYGPKKMADREKKTFESRTAAEQLFKAKSAEMSVNAFEEVRTVTSVVTKLS